MTNTERLAFEAVELAEDAMAYVPEYFVNKHGMNRRMAALKEALAAHDAEQAAIPADAGEERMAFEAALFDLYEFAPDRPSFGRYQDGDYRDTRTHKFWRVWQARAALAQRQPLTDEQTEDAYGWTDADADAARLALELECLLTDRDVPMPVTSRWWESAHEALALHRQRLESERAAAPQAAQPEPFPDTEAVTACWQDFGRTEDFRRAVKWSQDGEIPGALFVAFRAGLRAASPKARCDCGKKAAADCEKWEPGCDLGNSPEHARVVRIDLKPEQALPLKDRPDFIAGYYAGLKDGRACERRDAAEQAAQAVPAGFKWVPVEPTLEMLTAAGREDDKAFVDGMPHGATAADVWAVMLAAAAPAPQAQAAGHELADLFESWWSKHGQFCRAGGGDYEKSFAWAAWNAALAQRQPLTDEHIRREKPVCADFVSFRACVRCAEQISYQYDTARPKKERKEGDK